MAEAAKTAELTCPSCGEVVYHGEGFCEACGHRLSEDAEAAPGTDAAASPEGGCVGCGTGTIDDEGYCEQCGLRQPAERDHVEVELADGTAAGASDRGRRYSHNEDALALVRHPGGIAVVVSDGVGSSPHPEVASRTAADTGVEELVAQLESGADPETATRAAVMRAAEAVAALAESESSAPSCTFVSALTVPGSVTIGWVGDSRAYWLPSVPSPEPAGDPADTLDMGPAARPSLDGTPRVLTTDDSWAAFMVAEGALTEAEAEAHPNAHVITGWLGADAEEVRPHVSTFTHDHTVPGTLLVCSDGLWNYLPGADDLAAVLDGTGAGPLAAARALVRRALDAGGRDNITVAVIPLPPTSPPTSDPTMEHQR
ncbi:protein phosphatase 2C domain-containing protein [Actinomadura sp. SCN-SB]|uniref:protein phosphatase 2C domain-containing protein n=1 Tax=Actinomadura sp. SCN-SB TaxID=3373092 RepID=UPI003752F338